MFHCVVALCIRTVLMCRTLKYQSGFDFKRYALFLQAKVQFLASILSTVGRHYSFCRTSTTPEHRSRPNQSHLSQLCLNENLSSAKCRQRPGVGER